MAAPPLTEKELMRLHESWQGSVRDTETFRKQRNQTVRAFAGYRYGENAAPYKTPVNLLDMYVTTYSNALVPEHPRLMVTSEIPSLKGDAHNLELATERWSDLNEFSSTLRDCVEDALFAMGIIKVGEAIQGQADYDAQEMSCVFGHCVNFDDYSFDIQARSMREISFEGNEYSVGYDEMLKSKYYDTANKSGLQPSSDNMLDHMGHEKAAAMTRTNVLVKDGYRDVINLIDLYLPYENLIFTFAKDGDWTKPLHWREWDGPVRGPYHKLIFTKVPGNLLPKQLASEMFDLHDAFNRLLNKCVRSAEREKLIPIVQPGQDDDIQRLNKAPDGEATFSSGGTISEAHFGGVSQTSMAFVIALEAMFNKKAGNLDALAGLGVQAPTAAQENLIAQAASAQVKSMAKAVLAMTKGVLVDVGQYLYNSKVEIPLIYKPKGYEHLTALQVQRKWTPEMRRGDFMAYNFQADPYAAQAKTPIEQLQVIMQFTTQVLIPILPVLQAQGIQLNMKGLIKLFERLMNVKGLDEIVTYANPGAPEDQPQTIGEHPRMAASTTRNYVRESRPSASNQDKMGALMQSLLAGGGERVQRREMAKLAM